MSDWRDIFSQVELHALADKALGSAGVPVMGNTHTGGRMRELGDHVYVRPRPWVRGKRRREAWVALLAHSLDLMVNGTGGVGSERQHNYRNAERNARHLLVEPEVQEIRRSFHHVALTDVLDDIHEAVPGG